jgi:hypothetical protein
MAGDPSCGTRVVWVVCGLAFVLTATVFHSATLSTSSGPVRKSVHTAIGQRAPARAARLSGRQLETRAGRSPPRPAVWPSAAASVAWRERRPFDKAAAITEVGYPAKSTGGLVDEDRAVLARWYLKVRRRTASLAPR